MHYFKVLQEAEVFKNALEDGGYLSLLDAKIIIDKKLSKIIIWPIVIVHD